MMESEKYEWARDSLEGIAEWIEDNEHATEGQADAVDNIKNARRRSG